MEPIDYSTLPPSPSSAMDWERMYRFNEKPILVGEDDHPTYDPAPANPYRPCLTSEIIAGKMSGRSVMGSTVGTGGHMPSSYSEQPGKGARGATTAGEVPWSSVKCTRGIVTVGDVEVRELVSGCAAENPQPSVKGSTDETLLELTLGQLGMTREKMMECNDAVFNEKIQDSFLSEDDKVLLRDYRRKYKIPLKDMSRKDKNLLSQRKCRKMKAEYEADLNWEVNDLRILKASWEKRVLKAEKEVGIWQKKCRDLESNNLPFVAGWDQIDVEDRRVTVREDNNPACGSIQSSNCMPYLTPEVTAWETSGSSAIKSTVSRGASRPSPYLVPSARRAGNTTTGKASQPSVRRSRGAKSGKRHASITTTGKAPRSSVKRSRGAMIGENASDGTLQLGALIARYAGDITTTGEVPGPSVESSRGAVAGINLLGEIEVQELLTEARYVTAAGKVPGPSVEPSRGTVTVGSLSEGIEAQKRLVGAGYATTTEEAPQPPAKRSRGATTTGKAPRSSVRRSRGGATTGKVPRPSAKHSKGGTTTTEEAPQPPAKRSRGAATTGKAAKRSRGTTSGKRHANNTTTGKAPRPLAKPSGGVTTDKKLLKNALVKLGITEDKFITCTDEELNKIISSNSFLSMQEIAQLKHKRYRDRNNQACRGSRARKKKFNSETGERIRELESKNEELKEKIAALENDLKTYRDTLVKGLAKAKSVEV